MSRTDDDSWDITEGVGATALSVARARVAETAADCPLYTDPYAHFFLEAAAEAGWQSPFGDDPERMQGMAAYMASRTKNFDEFFTTAGADGIDQVVILAAGLDTRAWRLPWISGTVVFELDQPKVLEFKGQVLAGHGARPDTEYHPVPIDLRHDWPKALQQNGFDPSKPTAWSAEGLLPYLRATDQDRLLERIDALSATGSRIAVEAFGPDFYSADLLARRRERMVKARKAAVDAGRQPIPDPSGLWYFEPRTDVEQWLTGAGWDVTTTSAVELMEHYQRPAPEGLEDAVPDTVFVDARKL